MTGGLVGEGASEGRLAVRWIGVSGIQAVDDDNGVENRACSEGL